MSLMKYQITTQTKHLSLSQVYNSAEKKETVTQRNYNFPPSNQIYFILDLYKVMNKVTDYHFIEIP